MNKFVKAIAAIAAATICAVPMMNTINASAATYLVGDINLDGKIDASDYNLCKNYVNGSTATKESLRKKYPLIDSNIMDFNGDGKKDNNDAELIKFTYTAHPNFTYSEKSSFINGSGYIKINGVNRKAYTYGDANGDLMFSVGDIITLSNYFKNPSAYPTAQILFNRSWCVIVNHPNGKLVKGDYTHHLDRIVEILGDVNGNQIFDMSDGVALEQYVKNPSKYPTAGKYLERSDMDGDGKLTQKDVKAWEQIIQKNLYLLGDRHNNYEAFRPAVKQSLVSYLNLYK